jgi:hypothetical protein
MAITPGPGIIPDDKDWTWVLERRCPECGLDSRMVGGSEVPGMARRIADEWVGILNGAPAVEVRPAPDRWSTLEYGCHVRDVFRICHARLALMLIQDDPIFPNWDQDKTAEDDGYAWQTPGEVAIQVRRAAVRLADDLDEIPTRSWARTGRRSDDASFTVETFSRYLIHDPIHHLHDVGVPWGPAANP